MPGTLQVYSVFPIVMASLCVSVAAFEFLTWSRLRGNGYNFAFAIICLAAAAYDLACAGEYNVVTPAASVIWLRIQAMTLELTILSFFWYVAGLTGMVPRGVVFAAAGVFGIFLLFQVVVPGNLTWDLTRPEVMHVHLPLGQEVVYAEVESGPLTNLQYAVGVASFVYLVLVLVRHSRAGHRKEAMSLLVLSGIVFAASMNDLAVSESCTSLFSPWSMRGLPW